MAAYSSNKFNFHLKTPQEVLECLQDNFGKDNFPQDFISNWNADLSTAEGRKQHQESVEKVNYAYDQVLWQLHLSSERTPAILMEHFAKTEDLRRLNARFDTLQTLMAKFDIRLTMDDLLRPTVDRFCTVMSVLFDLSISYDYMFYAVKYFYIRRTTKKHIIYERADKLAVIHKLRKARVANGLGPMAWGHRPRAANISGGSGRSAKRTKGSRTPWPRTPKNSASCSQLGETTDVIAATRSPSIKSLITIANITPSRLVLQ